MYVNNYEEYLEYVESVKDQLWPFWLLPEIVTIRDARDPKKMEEEREAENNPTDNFESREEIQRENE